MRKYWIIQCKLICTVEGDTWKYHDPVVRWRIGWEVDSEPGYLMLLGEGKGAKAHYVSIMQLQEHGKQIYGPYTAEQLADAVVKSSTLQQVS